MISALPFISLFLAQKENLKREGFQGGKHFEKIILILSLEENGCSRPW